MRWIPLPIGIDNFEKNMSMLRYFFENGGADNKELFRGLKIMDAGEEYLAHMGKYPVISISLKSMKQYSYELAFDMLKKAVEGEFTRHWEEIEESGKLTGAKLERYIRIRDLKGKESDYADSLKFLSGTHISAGSMSGWWR